jgi:hypothetical protein
MTRRILLIALAVLLLLAVALLPWLWVVYIVALALVLLEGHYSANQETDRWVARRSLSVLMSAKREREKRGCWDGE